MRSKVRVQVGSWITALALVWPAGLVAGVARAQGVQTALMPRVQSVAPGADFTVELDVTQPGSPFNAFDAVLIYDPTALTYLPTSPLKLQEGCMMTGACSAACGSTSHYLAYGADSIWVSDGLFCAGTFLIGPGQLYHLRFHASSTPRVTVVRLRTFLAYNAGYDVTPIATANATVAIGVSLSADGTPSLARGLAVRATPNPARGEVVFSLRSDAAGEQELGIFDVLGRPVRVLSRGWQPPGTRQVVWDGRGAAAARVPAGLYLVTLRAGQQSANSRVVVID